MGLIYTDLGPKAVVIGTLPAHLTGVLPAGCALRPRLWRRPVHDINSGDTVEFRRTEHGVELEVWSVSPVSRVVVWAGLACRFGLGGRLLKEVIVWPCLTTFGAEGWKIWPT